MEKWYESNCNSHQGLVISEDTGRNIAVCYDKKDAPLVAAAPDLLKALIACRKYMVGEYTELDLVETDRLALDAIAKATE